jgi:hypothetical protein
MANDHIGHQQEVTNLGCSVCLWGLKNQWMGRKEKGTSRATAHGWRATQSWQRASHWLPKLWPVQQPNNSVRGNTHTTPSACQPVQRATVGRLVIPHGLSPLAFAAASVSTSTMHTNMHTLSTLSSSSSSGVVSCSIIKSLSRLLDATIASNNAFCSASICLCAQYESRKRERTGHTCSSKMRRCLRSASSCSHRSRRSRS